MKQLGLSNETYSDFDYIFLSLTYLLTILLKLVEKSSEFSIEWTNEISIEFDRKSRSPLKTRRSLH